MAEPIFTTLYTSMASWFTPTYLFCFLNLMIGTIFVASNFKSHKDHNDQDQQHPPPQLGRVSSLLNRVKSIDFSLYNSDKPDSYPNPDQFRGPSLLQRLNSFSLYNSEKPDPDSKPDPYPNRDQSRDPSLLDRDNSLSVYNSEQPDPDSKPDPTQVVRPASLLERVRSFSLYNSEEPEQDSDADPTRIVQAPSLLQRVKSIKFSRPDSFTRYAGQDHHVARTKSENCGEPARGPAKMTKSASEKNVAGSSREDNEEEEEEEEDVDRRRPDTVRERKRSDAASYWEDEEVDAKADDFISKFKQQLKLQRLDSLIRYKEMLNRGTGK